MKNRDTLVRMIVMGFKTNLPDAQLVQSGHLWLDSPSNDLSQFGFEKKGNQYYLGKDFPSSVANIAGMIRDHWSKH